MTAGDVTALPFAEGSFDCIVDTFSLCVYSRPAAALAEMARVVSLHMVKLASTLFTRPCLATFLHLTRLHSLNGTPYTLIQVKPDGRVLLLEHTRSDNPAIGWYQGVTSKFVAATGKGCVWDQDVLTLIRQAGLKPVRQDTVLHGVIRLIEARRQA